LLKSNSVGEKDYFCNKKNETTCAIFAKKQAWTEIEVFTTPWGQSVILSKSIKNQFLQINEISGTIFAKKKKKKESNLQLSLNHRDHFCKFV
jgi:hypothetical protein